MTTFTVKGPFEVPADDINGRRMIIGARLSNTFWQDTALELAQRRGCYVFVTKFKRTFTPWYVGRAANGFRQEIFTPDKLNKYNLALAKAGRGKPMMFFIVMPIAQGAPNVRVIGEVERFLIRQAKAENPHLLNVKNVQVQRWRINGVIYSAPGQPSRSAQSFRNAMGL